MNQIIKDIQARQVQYDLDNHVAMANDMIRGISKLSLNEAKLLRLIIMQVQPDDTVFAPFTIKVSEFAQLLGIDRHDVYRQADRMTDRLMMELIRIGDGNPRHKWQKFHWVSRCSYDAGILTIQLSDDLKPYLLGLKKWYTQYRLEDVISFRSVYAIRIYELIVMGMQNVKPYADQVTEVYISIDTIRKATSTENKLKRISQFKEKVIDISIRDINECTDYHVSVRDYKESRKIVGFYFTVQSNTRYAMYGDDITHAKARQMKIKDYFGET